MSTAATLLARYDQLSLRERAMVCLATLAALIALWDIALMQPLRTAENALTAELTSYDTTLAGAEAADAADPRRAAMTRAAELQAQMESVDAQLAATAAGFIPSQRMVEVIHDVLSRQAGLKLISLRNLPVTSLVPAPDANAPGTAPFVHPIELVIEGDYAAALTYLEALESLPWRFRWRTLDLTTKQYPVNRVRIELSTLSMDRTWLGVGQ